MTRALIDAVRTARDKLEPARIAFGSGISMANINRRARDVDGKISLGLNPIYRRSHIQLFASLARGSPWRLVTNYGMHGNRDERQTKISGDAPGTVTATLKRNWRHGSLIRRGRQHRGLYSVYPDPSSASLLISKFSSGPDRVGGGSAGAWNEQGDDASWEQDNRDAAQGWTDVAR